jgi:3-oxoacyl-[acyl-carrier protein] reductase
VSILVANAGITGPNTTLDAYPIDAWRQVIDIDLTGVFLCCRAVVPGMKARNYGRIVNVASVAARKATRTRRPIRRPRRRDRADEVARQGARDHRHPRQLRHARGGRDRHLQADEARAHQYMLSKIPLGRFGGVDEVAALIAWLASPTARSRPARCSTSRAAARPY